MGQLQIEQHLRAPSTGMLALENAETQVRLAALYIKARRIAPAKELLNQPSEFWNARAVRR